MQVRKTGLAIELSASTFTPRIQTCKNRDISQMPNEKARIGNPYRMLSRGRGANEKKEPSKERIPEEGSNRRSGPCGPSRNPGQPTTGRRRLGGRLTWLPLRRREQDIHHPARL